MSNSPVTIPTAFAGVTATVNPATGAASAAAAPATFTPPPPPEATPFTDPEFGSKVLALLALDDRYAREAASYLKPGHFVGPVDQNLAKIILAYVRTYSQLPGDIKALAEVVKAHPDLPAAEKPLYARRLVELHTLNQAMPNRAWIRDQAVDFCKRQALIMLASEIPTLLSKPHADFGKIRDELHRTMTIGEGLGANFRNLFDAAEIERRRERRDATATGKGRLGVPTGIASPRYNLDDLLYHRGWERGAFTGIMGRAKMGKTTFCAQSALLSAQLHGQNWLYVSLEVSDEIIEDRTDAMLTGVKMTDLLASRDAIASQVNGLTKLGKFFVERYPANTLTTDATDALVGRYFDRGIKLDGVVVDYLGIMRVTPADDRYIGLGNATKELRRIAGKYDVAMLSPIQTNRDGVGKANAGMDKVGESFAIVQDCDLLLALNATDQEIAAGVRRLTVAASRNTGGFTMKVKSNMEVMRIVEDVLDVTYD